MKCWLCGKEMENTIGGCYHCKDCSIRIDDLVFRTKEHSITQGNYEFKEPFYQRKDCSIRIDDLVFRTKEHSITQGNYEFKEPFYQQGWVCPKCGAVMSPDQPYCLFCKPVDTRVEVTTTGIMPTINTENKSISKGE